MAPAAEPPVAQQQFPRIAPTEAAKSPALVRLHAGLKLELVASEPLVSSPVGISFDENGRLFVVEMLGYPDLREQRPGRIKLLEDTHHDGHYDKATIYADNLPWPTSVLPYDGGVFVTASPDLLYLKDTHHDGIADVRRVVFTGFGSTTVPLNVQGLVNGLTWGPDNRIYGTTSENGGMVSRPGSDAPPMDLRRRDFSFDPRKLDLRPENGGGQHGLSFDDFGRRYVCFNNKAIQTFMYDAKYAGRNPLYAMPPALVDIYADGSDLFRISPDEAWRVLRTQWRVGGLVSGPVEGGGRASGYFTSSSGITIYTGDALPPEFHANAFVAEPANNLVHREIITPDGVGVIAHRAPEEKKSEFLASKDIWFRPVQLANGPDGALYIVDMYREVIEHPWSLPDSIKGKLDLHSGTERGRIWRVVPEGTRPRDIPNLSNATTPELVKLLEHPNGWHRDTAARLLYERNDPAALPLLEAMARQSPSAVGRYRALEARFSLKDVSQGVQDTGPLVAAMADPDPHVRVAAIKLFEPLMRLDGITKAEGNLRAMVNDPDPTVRYQLAFTLGERNRLNVRALGAIARRDFADKWIRAAVLSSSKNEERSLFVELWDDQTVRAASAGREFLIELATLVGARGFEGDISALAAKIGAEQDGAAEAFAFALARALREGMMRGPARATAASTLVDTVKLARAAASDAKTPEPARVEAIRLLGTTTYPDASAVLLPLLSAAQPQAVQSAAVGALDRFSDSRVAEQLVKLFSQFSPRLRSEVIGVLSKRPDRALVLLHAIESGSLRSSEIPSPQANALRRHPDPRVRELANKVLAKASAGRDGVIQAFMPALQLSGKADHGKAVYEQRCISCHRLGGEGNAVGPDLSTVRSAGKEKTLVNILDPNREVAPNYIAYIAETTTGDSLVGIIASETSNSLTLRQAYGKDTTLLRSDLKRLSSQHLSLMPEGLEEGLKPQDLADLLDYIMTAQEPPRPAEPPSSPAPQTQRSK